MKKIILCIAVLLLIQLVGNTQNAKLIYTDSSTNDNYIYSAIEDADGNYIYVGACAAEGVEFYGNGLISKVSPAGEMLARHVEYCEDPSITGVTNDLRYQKIFITPENTYFVVGSKVVKGNGFIIVREFDSDFNLLMSNETQISWGPHTSVYLMAKEYGDHQYVASFYYIQAMPTYWYGVASTCEIRRDGTLSNVQEMPKFSPSGLYPKHYVVNIVPINNGEKFMVISHGGYIIYDNDINPIETVELDFDHMRLISNFSDGIEFRDGKVIHFTKYMEKVSSTETQWSLGMIQANMSDLNNPSLLHKFGEGKTTARGGEVYCALSNSCDYITEDNLVFGGTFNLDKIGNSIEHADNPTIIGVGSYNRFEDKIGWEGYYEDGVHAYYMTSICATKDGGALVTATKASREQAEKYLSDIVLIKFKEGLSSVNNISNAALFTIYPNPANGNITLKFDSEGTQTVDFYNSTGRLCKTVNVASAEESINIADLTSGIYLLKLKTDGKTVANEKLVVR